MPYFNNQLFPRRHARPDSVMQPTTPRTQIVDVRTTEAPMLRPPTGLTLDQVNTWFRQNGICISEWCRYYQLNRLTVVELLRGRNKGLRGQAHRAAILLGLKDDPSTLQLAA